MRYRTPGGQVWTLYKDMAAQSHLLIAGATGSGKSVLINGLIYTVIHDSPAAAQLILIDPKRTELFTWQDLPHVIRYAYTGPEMVRALEATIDLMERRLQYMQSARLRTYDGSHVYVIIDELADLLLTLKKQAKPLLQRILQLGRAARIHVIAASQCVNATVISTELKVNMPAIVGLKTATRAHSRLIVDIPGCEQFPDPVREKKAYAYYRRGALCELYSLPMIPDADIDRLCRYWTSRECIA